MKFKKERGSYLVSNLLSHVILDWWSLGQLWDGGFCYWNIVATLQNVISIEIVLGIEG